MLSAQFTCHPAIIQTLSILKQHSLWHAEMADFHAVSVHVGEGIKKSVRRGAVRPLPFPRMSSDMMVLHLQYSEKIPKCPMTKALLSMPPTSKRYILCVLIIHKKNKCSCSNIPINCFRLFRDDVLQMMVVTIFNMSKCCVLMVFSQSDLWPLFCPPKTADCSIFSFFAFWATFTINPAGGHNLMIISFPSRWTHQTGHGTQQPSTGTSVHFKYQFSIINLDSAANPRS